MKTNLLKLSLLGSFIIVVTTIFTYQVFATYRPPAEIIIQEPSLSLILPDQNYLITLRDLETRTSDLIIPTKDLVTPKITYNQNLGIIESLTSPQDYVIDIKQLHTFLQESNHLTELSFAPSYYLRDRYTTSLEEFNRRLNLSYRNELSINLKDGGDFAQLTLDPYVLRQIIRPISTDTVHPLELDKEQFLGFILPKLTPKQKTYFNPDVAYQNTKNALNSRFMGNGTPTVLGVDDGPSSRGEIADKYLEVDLSQQKMYFFIGGSLYKEYKISSGSEYPTPVGEFHILNKAPNAYSAIYDVWMPYWMGFAYASDVKAYLGLHEIAYAVDESGKQLYRYGNYIGEMMTGGCIAMEPNDSREIYNLSEVGMLVRIVK